MALFAWALMVILLARYACARQLRLAWNPNPETDGVTHYRLYRRGVILMSIPAPATTVVADLESGDWVYLTAVNAYLESDPSDPLFIPYPDQPPIARDDWTVSASSSESAELAPGMAIDGDPSTYWRTPLAATTGTHDFIIDTGAVQSISGLSYLPRQDGELIGNILQYEIATSGNGVDWFTVTAGQWANNASLKDVFFSSSICRYVRLRSLGLGDANAAEIQLFAGTVDPPPIVTKDVELTVYRRTPSATENLRLFAMASDISEFFRLRIETEESSARLTVQRSKDLSTWEDLESITAPAGPDDEFGLNIKLTAP